jgi:hypothetical protein
VARRGAGKRAPKGQIVQAHGILVIPCGHTGMWAGMRKKNPTESWVRRQVFDAMPQMDGGRSGARWR